MFDPPPPPEREAAPTLSPSEFVRRARDLLERNFARVTLEGEIAHLSKPASGHLYFALKDAAAQVRCALFRNRALFLRFRPAEGMLVQVTGRASLYEGRGEFQLIVDQMAPAGAGVLRQAFEALKAKLAAEGLFDEALKRPLPRLPRRLGLLTSRSGAAVHDVLSVLERRFPLIEVELLPIPVQGAEAAPRARRLIARASASGRYDVLLLTRGGGSADDLACFNDEALARAIRASAIPVVSAIGHEIDFTIADFVADLRAATPSAAAERLVPSRDEFELRLRTLQRRLRDSARRHLREHAQRLDALDARLTLQAPARRLERTRARLRELVARLRRAPRQRFAVLRSGIGVLDRRLVRVSPGVRIAVARGETGRAASALAAGLRRLLERRRARLGELGRALHAVSPLATLERGYAVLIEPATGAVVRSVAGIASGQPLTARLPDGELGLGVLRVAPKADTSGG
jgi:exodeoxyribonuclease VII large subunit